MFYSAIRVLLPAIAVTRISTAQTPAPNVCTVPAGGNRSIDDAPAIIAAFEECGNGGTVKFSNTTYYVNSIMNVQGLKGCQIDLKGTLKVQLFDRTSLNTRQHH